jgi:HSP20 family protein
MLTLRDQMDRLFENTLGLDMMSSAPRIWGLNLDVSETDDQFKVKASVPGLNPDQIDITLEKNVLTIKGETETEDEQEGEVYHLRERRFGSFSRSITLPGQVDPDAVSASYDNGVLTVTVPKTEEAKPRRIPIHNGHKAIEG